MMLFRLALVLAASSMRRIVAVVLFFAVLQPSCFIANAADYQGPSALVLAPDGSRLYVACTDASRVAWIDCSRNAVERRITMPIAPRGLALSPDGATLAVTCSAPVSSLVLLDTVTGRIRGTIAVGHTAVSPIFSPDGALLYACNRFDNDVSVVDVTACRQIARIPVVREPIAAAITPDGRRLFVANHLPFERADGGYRVPVTPYVTVIDTETFKTTQIELTHGSHNLRGLSITPDGKYVFATHLLSNFEEIPFRVEMGWINVNVVSVIDADKRKLMSTIGLDENYMGVGNPWGVTCARNGKTVCVTSAGTNNLCVIDTSGILSDFARRTMQPMMGVWPIYTGLGESLWRRIPVPGVGARAIAASGSTVYVAQYFSDSIAVVDLDHPESTAIRTVALGPTPQWTAARRGEMLFHDATICYEQWQSCSSCHPDGRSDSLNWDLMNDNTGNPKNTKSLLLAHKTPPAMSRAVRESAEVAVRSGLSHILFADRPDEEAEAIDAYLKSLTPVPSPHLVDGHFSESAKRGQALFENPRIGCFRCHPAPLYTDLRSHDVDTGTGMEAWESFDTPTLIESWRTAPYLHTGHFKTIKSLLEEGRHGMKTRHRLKDADLHDLIEFVLSL